MSDEIKIYVADLAAYNAGHLHGVWIDATLDIEDIQAQIQRMLSLSPVEDAEEYAIHGATRSRIQRVGTFPHPTFWMVPNREVRAE